MYRLVVINYILALKISIGRTPFQKLKSPNKQSQIEKTDEHASSRKRIPYSAANIAILTDWIRLNKLNPYATTKAKLELAAKTQLSTKQITCWLINTRRSEWFKLEREEFMNSK